MEKLNLPPTKRSLALAHRNSHPTPLGASAELGAGAETGGGGNDRGNRIVRTAAS